MVELLDNNDKEIISDFCFGTKEDAQKLGDKLNREYQNNKVLEKKQT